jgi:putative phage-type endonuclease
MEDNSEIPKQVPVYCARCYHTLCIPLPKNNESDNTSISSESLSLSLSDSDDDDSDGMVSPIFQEDPEDVEEIILEEIAYYMQSNPLAIWRASFEKDAVKEISSWLYEEWYEDDLCEEHDIVEIQEWVKRMLEVYLKTESEMPPRQGGDAKILTPLRKASIANKLRILANIPTPQQRTPEWYEARYSLLTASNVWKAIGSEAQQNQLIVEKCIPFEKFKEDCSRYGNLSPDNPMAWGQKYEPISALIYERMNKTTLGEYGCIVHPEWSFLGASPDGINTDPTSSVYGRMVEIKNIVNRTIDGVPLDAYWAQMQIQMEVCDLDECDFVETRIKEYPSKTEFLESTNPWSGLVLSFVPRITIEQIMQKSSTNARLKPFYEYFVLPEKNESSIESIVDEWIQTQKDKYPEYVLSNCSYWGLDQYSCVLVKRNRVWFNSAIPKIERLWRIVETERLSGCEHRTPKKREVKQPTHMNITKLDENITPTRKEK